MNLSSDYLFLREVGKIKRLRVMDVLRRYLYCDARL